MGDYGSVLIKEKNVDKHRNFEKDLFTRTDGNWQIKLVMSSYSFVDSKNAQGPPDGSSDCSRCVGSLCGTCTKSVPYTPAYDANVTININILLKGMWIFQRGEWPMARG